MFDSGVGGLTVLHECLVSLPAEDFLYLGDSAKFPYGTKTAAELRERVVANTELLLDRGAKLLVIACNSATSAGADAAREIAAAHGVEVVTVIGPRGRDRGGDHRRRQGRGAGDAGDRRGRRLPAGARGAGPGPRGDRGRGARPGADHPERLPVRPGGRRQVRSYCAPLRAAEVDTLILGCTHYPLVAPMLQRILGRDVRLVTGGHAVAAAAQRILESRGLARSERTGEGEYRFLCTGDVDSFRELGTRFLQMPLGEVERV